MPVTSINTTIEYPDGWPVKMDEVIAALPWSDPKISCSQNKRCAVLKSLSMVIWVDWRKTSARSGSVFFSFTCSPELRKNSQSWNLSSFYCRVGLFVVLHGCDRDVSQDGVAVADPDHHAQLVIWVGQKVFQGWIVEMIGHDPSEVETNQIAQRW